ncbi:MAG: hypothetical protein Aurels2KO_11700 [Aureliella sp.]
MRVVFSTDMRCGKCLAKVSERLDSLSGVGEYEAKLDDPRKLLVVELGSEQNIGAVVGAVADAGFTAEKLPNDEASNEAEATKFKLSNYKPLALVVAYVVAASVFVQWRTGQWSVALSMQYFMGFFFLGFAFFKLLDIAKFADAFASYDPLASRWRFYGLCYPLIEVALGLMFVTQTWLIAANVLTMVLLGIGLVGVVTAVRRQQAIQCACLGTAFNLPMSTVTIVENSIMIAMAIVALARM